MPGSAKAAPIVAVALNRLFINVLTQLTGHVLVPVS